MRESLTPEETVARQIVKCNDAFNENNRDLVESTVTQLQRLVTPDLLDDEYLAKLQELEDEWEEEKAVREKAYKKRLAAASGGNPENVQRPVLRPGVDHFGIIFMACLSLFERHKMWFKKKTEATL